VWIMLQGEQQKLSYYHRNLARQQQQLAQWLQKRCGSFMHLSEWVHAFRPFETLCGNRAAGTWASDRLISTLHCSLLSGSVGAAHLMLQQSCV